MLSFKWTLLFLVWLISNVAAIPRITTQDIEIFVGAAGTIGFAGVLGWHLLKNPKKAEDAIVHSQKDGIPVMHPTSLPAPTPTPTALKIPNIIETIVSKSSPDVTPRFFAVAAWHNGTIIQVEEIVRFRTGDLNDRYPTSSVTVNNETCMPHEWLDHEIPQASDVFMDINISETRPSALNVFSPPWNLASIFVNAHADRKMKPVIKFARKRFFVVRDLLNKALAIFLRLVPTHPAKAAFILVGVPLVTKFGPAAARKGLVLLCRYAPLALLYLQDNLDRFIEWHTGREEEPEPIVEAATEPLSVEGVVPAPDSTTNIPLDATIATQVTSNLTETRKDDDEESLPHQTVDVEENLPTASSSEDPPLIDRENYTETGIFKTRKSPWQRSNSQHRIPRRIPLRSSRLEKTAVVTSTQESRELLPNEKPEVQTEASSLRLADVSIGSLEQPRPAHLIAQGPEDTVAPESENTPLSQSSMNVLPALKDIPVLDESHENEPANSQLWPTAVNEHDLVVPEDFITDDYGLSTDKCPFQPDLNPTPLLQHEQELATVHDSEPSFKEQSITMVPESVDSPACAPISSTSSEDDKKDEDNEPQEQSRRGEYSLRHPTVEDDEEEDVSPKASGPSTGILEAIAEEEGPTESRDKSLQDDAGSNNSQASDIGLCSEGIHSPSQLGTVDIEERFQEPTESPAGWTDNATGATDDSIDLEIADFGGLFDSDTPVSTPSKQPVVDQSSGAGRRCPGGLRSQTRTALPKTSRPEQSRGVTFATESDGSVISHTCHFRAEEAPAALRESMVIDAQGPTATGVRLSAEESIPVIAASAGEQQQLKFAAERPAPEHQAPDQEQSLSTPGIDPAFLRSLQSFSLMSAEYQAQSIAETASRAAAFSPASGQANSGPIEGIGDGGHADSDPMEVIEDDDQADSDPMEVTEDASETDPLHLRPHKSATDDGIDEFLSASMSGLSLGLGAVDMEYEHDGPAAQIPLAKEALQTPPSQVQPPVIQEQAAVIVPGYEPALPTGMDIERDGSATPEQYDLLESHLHPTEMQEELMTPEEVAALLEFNSGATFEIPQAASNDSVDQSTYQPRRCEENPLQSPLPGLQTHHEADLEAERREKVGGVKRRRDDNNLLPGEQYPGILAHNRATRYAGLGRKLLPMKSVYFRCDPSLRDILLEDSSQQTVNPFANLTYTVAPVNPVSQVSRNSDALPGGTQSQDRANEMNENSQYMVAGGDGDDGFQGQIDMASQTTPGEVEGDTENQGEMVSQYPPLDDDVFEYRTMFPEPEDDSQGHSDPLDGEFEAAQLAYERQRTIAETHRRGEETGENQDTTSSYYAFPANAERGINEDEESGTEEKSDEEGGEDPWGYSDEEDNDGYGEGYGYGDSGGSEDNGEYGDGDSGGPEDNWEYGDGDSGGSSQERGLGDTEEFSEEGEEEEEESDDDDDDDIQWRIFPGEDDGLPCRERMFLELDRLQAKVPQPPDIQEPRRIFVNRRREYQHASVVKNVWWFTTPTGSEWLWNNWEGIREHGWDMIYRCQDLVEDQEQLEGRG
ncbi:hypothetical protein CLAIMM_07368 [Cladophialophora immunda]|nr:hypothetical protein CLAIMM_07368 [Cladophialophora immunda]